MSEKPILFSTPMVAAILDGKKTMTRRIVKFQDGFNYDWSFSGISADGAAVFWSKAKIGKYTRIKCPYGTIGTRLWVRETFATTGKMKNEIGEGSLSLIAYKASFEGESAPFDGKWKPSIFMPRELSRITLEITNIRVEKLQDITEADAIAEGVTPDGGDCGEFFDCGCCETAKDKFQNLWHKINGEKSWNDNPFVWVVEFKKL